MSDDLFSQNEALPHSTVNMSAIQNEIQTLSEDLHRYDALYREGDSGISDAEFDAIMNRLKDLERQHPSLALNDSPTRTVGGTPLSSFSQVTHAVPMLSIEDIHELKPEEQVEGSRSTDPLRDWYERIVRTLGHSNFTLTVEPKIDGVAVSLFYKNGTLQYAATRGDGITGDNITQNVLTIKSLPHYIPKAPPTFEVRGEIFMPNKEFATLNAQQEEKGEPTFKNPRNATAGTVKQLDPRLVAARPLDCVLHSFGLLEPAPFSSMKAFQDTLSTYGLKKSSWFKEVSTVEELLCAVEQLDEDRHALPYATDGAVVKVNDLSLHTTIGYTSKFPKWACAFKYLPEQAETTLESITIQVGRTGVLTPVAELMPVDVSGTTVSRATLHNQEEIERKDIRIGDKVVIEKAGEIIPAVVKVLFDQRPKDSSPFSLYDYVKGKCPSCNKAIEQQDGFVAWRCVNFQCPDQAVTRITHFTARKALDIDGIGESVAVKLVENNMVKGPLDLFSLTEEDLANLMLDPAESATGETISKERRFGEKRARKAIDSLEQARTESSLAKWLFGLGIPNVGESTSKEVSRLHETLTDVPESRLIETIYAISEIEEERKAVSPGNRSNPPKSEEEKTQRKREHDQLKASKEELEAHLAPYEVKPDLGVVSSQSILHFFQSTEGETILTQLKELGINPTSQNYLPMRDTEGEGSALAGKIFVITGTLSQPRGHYKDLIEQAGGKVSGSISKNTNYLLAGEKAGSKLTKAESLGVHILNEESLMNLLS